MTEIKIQNVTCTACNMIASCDREGRCEFCRPRRTEISIEPAWSDFEKEDLYVLAFAIVVLGFLIWFAPAIAP